MTKKHPCTHKGCDKVFDKPFGLTMHMVHGHGIKLDGSATKKPKKPKKRTTYPKAVAALVRTPRALKFCPCCGLNVEVAEKALNIAQEMSA